MKRGFTLVEVLIAAALSAVLLSSMFISAFSLIRSWKIADRAMDALDSGRYSLFKIISDTRNSRGIRTSSSGSNLVLDFGPDTVSYDMKDDKVRRRTNGASAYLTEAGRVSFLNFSYPSPKLVVIAAGIQFGRGSSILTGEALVRN